MVRSGGPVGVGGAVVVVVVVGDGSGCVVGVGPVAGVCAPAPVTANSDQPAATLTARSAVSGRGNRCMGPNDTT
jgi:hypothetical protein